MTRYYAAGEPSGTAAWDLAHRRLAADDAKAREWLDRACRKPDPNEVNLGGRPAIQGPECKLECGRKPYARGLCELHYRQEMRRLGRRR